MADPTYAEVTHEGVTVGSNFDSEETIRQQLEAPVVEPETPQAPEAVEEPVGELITEPVTEKPEAKADDEAIEGEETSDPDDSKPERLFFRGKDGKFRRAGSKEVKHALQKRVDELTAKYRLTEAELRQVRERPVEALVAAKRPEPAGKPTLEQFSHESDPYAAYLEALTDWKAEEKIRAFQHEQVTARQRQQEVAQVEAFQRRQAEFAADHPDYSSVVLESDLTVSPLMTQLFAASERGPDFMYYLGKHPGDCLDLALATMSVPVTEQSLQALDRRLTLRMEAAEPTGPSASQPSRPTPKPITPVRTGRPADTDRPPGDDAPLAEHMAYWNAREREARRR